MGREKGPGIHYMHWVTPEKSGESDIAVFSPAYLRDSGPLPLQCWFNFDVGLGWSQWL